MTSNLKWILIIGGIALFIGAAGSGTYYVMNAKEEPASDTNTTTKKTDSKNETAATTDEKSASPSSSSSSKSTPSTPVAIPPGADATAGWQTYTNRDIGYIVKYPQGWTLVETNRWEDSKHYRYITIKSWENSVNRITIHWGFVRNGTFLYSTDRTGMGAGDLVEVTTNLPVLSAPVKKSKLIYEGKIKEWFYTPRTTPTGYVWESSITLDDQSDYNAIDLTGVSQIDMAEAILANITMME